MNMETTSNEFSSNGLVSRAVALGMAFATTAFIATSVAVIFTGNSRVAGAALVRFAAAPIVTLFGG